MKRKLLSFALGALLFTACGDDSSSGTDSGTSVPDKPSFNVSSCQEVNDPSVSAELKSAKASIADILSYLGENNLKLAQAVSAQTKGTFKAVLDKYPANCEAQLGYALSIVTDLINNAEIKAYIDTVSNKNNLVDLDVDDVNQIMIAGNGKHIPQMAQEAMAQAIPSLDSAMIYMKNVVSDDKFTCNYTYNDRTFELDRGEFAPTLAALYIAKAVLTFGASVNIDYSADGKYDWINDFNNSAQIPNSTAKQAISLMSNESYFTSVYSNWKSSYKKIPSMLDSAITYVQLGLQYGIEESKQGATTQLNDPYIVGDDEMSDVSAADFQKAIDSLEYYRQTLRTGATVTLPQGTKIKVNIAKFFENTDGWQKYLPYHKFNNPEKWNIPEDGFYWSEKFDDDDIYAELEVKEYLKKKAEKEMQFEYYNSWLTTRYDWDTETSANVLCINLEMDEETDDYRCFNVDVENCTLSFSERSDYQMNEQLIAIPDPIKLSDNVCKVENGTSLFATANRWTAPNPFYFTDASGNKTISYQALENGKNVDGDFEDYKLDDLENLIFFPDITFGGVLPEMTAPAFWQMLKNEYRDNED